MAHLINVENGTASMAYVGRKPWHGLGQELTEDASLEVWAQEAGMQYDLLKAPLLFQPEGAAAYSKFDKRSAIYRSDNQRPLAVVSDSYKLVQPSEVLGFFKDLTEKQGFKLETAGVLKQGQTYWALARTGHEVRIAGTDVVKGYVLLATSCDGTMATTAKFTSIRVVCNNTLQLADSDGAGVKVYHSASFDEAKVKAQLGLMDNAWDAFADKAAELAKRKVSDQEAVSYLIKLMGDAEKPLEQQPRPRELAAVLELFKGKAMGSDLKAADGTAWGLVNAVTEYVDHHKGRLQDNRLANAWFYTGKNLKVQAFNDAMALAA